MTWAGRLLVATPELAGPTFARTVLLLLQHGADDGALGVVLNRPSGTAVDEVLPGWQELAADPEVIFQGGPVQTDAAICLARRAGQMAAPSPQLAPVPGADQVGTVDLDADPALIRPLVAAIRVFAGYAGWAPGQLEGEIDEGSWWLLDALPSDPFGARPELLWRQVLRRQGGTMALMSTYPEDPTAN